MLNLISARYLSLLGFLLGITPSLFPQSISMRLPRSLSTSNHLVRTMGISGFPVTGLTTQTRVITGFPATGLNLQNRDCFGLLATGVMLAASMGGTPVIGVAR